MYNKSDPKTNVNPQRLTDAWNLLNQNPVVLTPASNRTLQPVLVDTPYQKSGSGLMNTNLTFFKAHYLETGEFYPNLRKKIEDHNNNRRLNPRLPSAIETEDEIRALSMQKQS